MVWPFRRRARDEKTITAAAVDLVERGPAAYAARQGEDSWQKEAWRQYDVCGELRYATQWISNAISLADLFAAEVDPATGLVGDATDDARVQAVVASIFGGMERRPQAQSTIATNWQVAGEAFVLIRSGRGAGTADEWLVMSSSEVTQAGGSWKYIDPVTGLWQLVTGRDKLIRLWNPHPSRQVHADSSVRSALPILNEIERTSQNIAARLVSRIASNGVWLLPQEIDFPRKDDDPPGPQGFMEYLARAGEAAMQDVGQASSQMPLIGTLPAELLDSIKDPISFATELSAEVLDLRTSALRRLATSLDMPAEIMLGMGESNHWSAWQIEEAAYKIHVAPVLDRIASALTEQYLQPILTTMGIEANRYILSYDTTEIISRPNRTEELVTLYDKRLISDDYLRAEAGVPDSAKPSEEERVRRLLEDLVAGAPTLLADSSVQDALGVELEVVPPGAVPVDEVIEGSTAPDNVRALPERAPQAEEDDEPDATLVAAAELAVFDALSRVGKRMLTREYRGQFQQTPAHELYYTLPVDRPSLARAEELLEGSFAFTDPVAEAAGFDPQAFRMKLTAYTATLINARLPHRKYDLVTELKWFIHGQRRHGR